MCETLGFPLSSTMVAAMGQLDFRSPSGTAEETDNRLNQSRRKPRIRVPKDRADVIGTDADGKACPDGFENRDLA